MAQKVSYGIQKTPQKPLKGILHEKQLPVVA